jgi:hypothetical protein
MINAVGWAAKGQSRQDGIRRSLPHGRRQDRPGKGKELDEDGCQDKARHRDAKGRAEHQGIVHPCILAPRRQKARCHTGPQGQYETDQPQLGRYGHAFRYDFIDRLPGVFKRRPQIQYRRVFQIIAILRQQRVVEMIPFLYIGKDGRRQFLFLRKRTTRNGMHEPEGNGNDCPQDNNGAAYALDHIQKHGPILFSFHDDTVSIIEV